MGFEEDLQQRTAELSVQRTDAQAEAEQLYARNLALLEELAERCHGGAAALTGRGVALNISEGDRAGWWIREAYEMRSRFVLIPDGRLEEWQYSGDHASELYLSNVIDYLPAARSGLTTSRDAVLQGQDVHGMSLNDLRRGRWVINSRTTRSFGDHVLDTVAALM